MKKVLALLALMFLAASSFAATWDMYGSVRVKGFYSDRDKYTSGSGESDLDLDFGLQTNSRVGANVKVNDKLSATLELGVNSSNVTTRLLYGTYDFGAFKLKLGQDYTPSDFEPFSQVYWEDDALDYFGGVSTGRKSQLSFIFPFGLEVALVKPTATNTKTFDVTLPKVEAAYNYKFGAVSGKVFAGYQTYKYDGDTNAKERSVNAYLAGLGLTADFAPVLFNGVAWVGQNAGDYGLWSEGTYDYASNENSQDFGFALEVGYALMKDISVNLGYGYQSADRDDFAKADKQQSFYVNAPITIAKGFTIVPEIGVLDYMKDAAGAKEGKETYFGAKFQMDF